MTLAERLDKFLKDYDFHDYQDNDGSVEEAEKILKESPETVISNLLDILEEKTADPFFEFAEDVLVKNFNIDESKVKEIARRAYECYCKSGSPGYGWDEGLTQYDAIKMAANEYGYEEE